MRVPTDLTCAICEEVAEEPAHLAECLECSRWFHLNPYSNRPGKDCGDAVIGMGDGIETTCNDCIEAAERRRVAALGERFDRLSKSKNELEQRVAALTECFGSLETIRQDVGEQFKRLTAALDGHLKR